MRCLREILNRIMVIVFILCLCAADRSDLRVVAGLMIVSGGWLCAAHAGGEVQR